MCRTTRARDSPGAAVGLAPSSVRSAGPEPELAHCDVSQPGRATLAAGMTAAAPRRLVVGGGGGTGEGVEAAVSLAPIARSV